MHRFWKIGTILLLLAGSALSEDKPTSLSDARTAAEANLRTSEGKTYDEKLGAEFVQKHLGALRPCKQAAGDDLRSFWILLKVDKDGTVKEVLLSPETKMGPCTREALLKISLLPPPRPAYWVSIYLKLAR